MAVNLLNLFDRMLQNIACKLLETNTSMEAILFMKFMNFDGIYHEELAKFITWLISNNDREIFFTNKCNIKFVHTEAKIEKLKIFIYSNSHCNIQIINKEWTERCRHSWEKHIQRTNKQSTKETKIHPQCIIQNISDKVPTSVSLKSSNENEKKTDEIQISNQTSTIVQFAFDIIEDGRKKNSTVNENVNIILLEVQDKLKLIIDEHDKIVKSAELEINILKRELQRKDNSLKKQEENAKSLNSLISDLQERLIALECPRSRDARINLSSSDLSELSLHYERMFRSVNSSLQNINLLHNSPNPVFSRPSSVSPSGSNDSISPCEFLDMETMDTMVITQSSNRNDPYFFACYDMIKIPSTQELYDHRDKKFDLPSTDLSDESRTTNERKSDGSDVSGSSQDEKRNSFEKHIKMSKNVSFSFDNEAINDTISVLSSQSSKDFISKNLQQFTALTVDGLCKIHNIKCTSVFEGEEVLKRNSTDVFAKKRFIWIDHKTNSIHWSKSKKDKANSKCFIIRRTVEPLMISSQSTIKGFIQSYEFGDAGLVINTELGEYMEIKLPASTIKCWEKVFFNIATDFQTNNLC